MDKSQHVVALSDSGHDNTNSVLVVDLVDIFVVEEDLLIDAVDALDSS